MPKARLVTELEQLILGPEFNGSQRKLALKAGLDPTILNRIILGHRNPTPAIVGRLCRVVPGEPAGKLLCAFLADIAEETTAVAVDPKAKLVRKAAEAGNNPRR